MHNISVDPEFKGVLGKSLVIVSYLNYLSEFEKREEPRISYSKEVFLTIPVVIYARKEYFLLNEINKNIDVLESAGFMEAWQSQYKRWLQDNKNVGSPKVLNTKHLSGSFQLFLLGHFTSFIVFLGELLIKLVSKWELF